MGLSYCLLVEVLGVALKRDLFGGFFSGGSSRSFTACENPLSHCSVLHYVITGFYHRLLNNSPTKLLALFHSRPLISEPLFRALVSDPSFISCIYTREENLMRTDLLTERRMSRINDGSRGERGGRGLI